MSARGWGACFGEVGIILQQKMLTLEMWRANIPSNGFSGRWSYTFNIVSVLACCDVC